jgi:putative endopeptidase
MISLPRILTAAIACAMASSAALAATSPSGIDLKGIDAGVKPGDDFNGYANGAWARTAEIPADRSGTGVFLEVFQRAEQRTADLIKAAGQANAPAGSNQRRIADYYAAYMNEAAIEKAGLKPLQPELDRIDAIKDRAGLSTALGAQLRADVDPINATNLNTEHLLGLFVAQGLEDPSKNYPYLLQGGLGMPNRDYYLKQDKDMAELRSKYAAYVQAVLAQAGTPDAAGKARAIVALETKIAQAHTSIVDSEDPHKANNVWPRDAFASKAPGIDWPAWFKAAGLDNQPTFIVWQPATLGKLSALVASEPLDTWKAWLRFHAINEDASGLLGQAYDTLAFDFYGKTLSGTPRQRDRWKRGIGRVNEDLGDAVGQIYVQKYFPASSREEVQAMVKNILKAFDQRVDSLDWMAPETRQKAKAKIATIKVGVGYPDTWRDYASLDIRPDDPLGNHERARLAEYRHQVAKLGKPVDRDEWWMTPQTVNAVNLPLQNALNFPAAILEAPFFDPKADAAANYGSIGAIIGHEISHSFDNLGAEFDAQGRLANWWTEADQKHFKEAGQRLVQQFNQYEALPGLHVNGQQTLGENIADVSGLTIAHAAYLESLGGKPAPVIDGLTGDQRFFLAFGQSWRSKVRDAALRQQVIGDVHAPGQFRAQTVRNIDAWYDAFKPQPGQKLYLDPRQRVKIW